MTTTATTAPSPAPAAPTPARPLAVIELLMRNRYRFYAEVRDGTAMGEKLRAMLIFAPLFLALFGAVIGSDHSVLQALSSAVKLPVLFVVTLIICVPTLYFFTTICSVATLSMPRISRLNTCRTSQRLTPGSQRFICGRRNWARLRRNSTSTSRRSSTGRTSSSR